LYSINFLLGLFLHFFVPRTLACKSVSRSSVMSGCCQLHCIQNGVWLVSACSF